MKYIPKKSNNEPKEVIEKRTTPGSSFDDLPKEPLRKALLIEQGYICAYCMQRIKNDSKSTKIEHWSPRSKKNEKDFMNLLAVCKGNEGVKGKEHCDTLKKNKKFSISPVDKSCEKLVQFDSGGKVYSNNENIDVELNEVLGLNQWHLVEERRELLDMVKVAVENIAKNKFENKIKEADLNNMLKNWQALKKNVIIIHGEKIVEKKYEPFCQVAITYLQKKMARLS